MNMKSKLLKKLFVIIFLGIALNAYSQTIFNGYKNEISANLGITFNEKELSELFLSGDSSVFSLGSFGDIAGGGEFGLMPSDGFLFKVGLRLLYGYNLGTDVFSIYPYGGLSGGLSDYSLMYMDDEDEISVWYADAILGARLNLYKGLGVFAEYTHYIASKIKPSITVGLSFSSIASSTRAAPAPKPTKYPTITPEELRRVELAYAETVRTIENRGKKLYIYNLSDRSAFIQRYQGSPNTRLVNEARNTKLPYYSINTTSEQDIVALAKQEPNDFMKVRMIHDWVSDVFSYDDDLLWWMDNVSGRNAEFTLGQIVQRQRGVCYEYAILFWFLMDAVGIDTYLIIDNSNPDPNIAHAYNMVVIDGTGYIIDTTWDSGNWYENGRITKFDRMIQKKYFMPDVSQSYRLRPGW